MWKLPSNIFLHRTKLALSQKRNREKMETFHKQILTPPHTGLYSTFSLAHWLCPEEADDHLLASPTLGALKIPYFRMFSPHIFLVSWTAAIVMTIKTPSNCFFSSYSACFLIWQWSTHKMWKDGFGYTKFLASENTEYIQAFRFQCPVAIMG